MLPRSTVGAPDHGQHAVIQLNNPNQQSMSVESLSAKPSRKSVSTRGGQLQAISLIISLLLMPPLMQEG